MDLSYNQVESLHGFKGQLLKLMKLSLKKNKMNSLANIEAFPNVNYLKLSRNNIDSFAEIKKLAKLRSLKGVSLYDNPVGDDKRVYCIAVLQICPFLETLDHKSCLEVKKSHDIKEEDLLKREEERKRVAVPHQSTEKPRDPSPKNSKQNTLINEDKQLQFKNQTVLLSKAFNNSRVGKNPATDKSPSVERKVVATEAREQLKEIEVNRFDDAQEEEEELEKDETVRGGNPEDLHAMNPKSLSAVRLAFEKVLRDKNSILGSTAKSDEEVWLGSSQSHPIGMFKRTGSNTYRVVGDGIWMMMASKVVNLKAIEEVAAHQQISFEYVFIDNFKIKSVISYFSQIKKLKSLKLLSNNIYEYLELVKFEVPCSHASASRTWST